MKKEYINERLGYWREKPIIGEKELIDGKHGLETRVSIMLDQPPIIDSGGAIFRGVYAGVSVVADAGVVVGSDSHDLYTMTFYTPEGIRVWAETYDTDDSMDSAAYLAHMAAKEEEKKIPIIIGGILNQEGVTEFKMEYLVISGPNGKYEERLLVAQANGQKNTHFPTFRRLIDAVFARR